MDYKKSKNIWRNNFPDYIKKTFPLIGGITYGKYTIPKQGGGRNITSEQKKLLTKSI